MEYTHQPQSSCDNGTPRERAEATLDRPIFIVGTGRSGTTIFHEIFTHHPNVAFLSGLCLLYPDKPQWNRRAMRMMDIPLIRKFARKKFRPAEHWGFWERHVLGFSNPCRDLAASDVRPLVKQKITKILAAMLTSKRNRLLVKLTGWPRTGFLSEIFPTALFIHVIRDGRAVANSLLDMDFWDGWRGPPTWRWAELSPAYQAEWRKSQESFIVLAAIQWKILMDSFEQVKKVLPAKRFLEVKYEDFIADPKRCFAGVLHFCQLDFPSEFQVAIESFRLKEMNYKWKKCLTGHQQQLLQDSLKDHLLRYGYEYK
jgi:omega-hydroxy-beta-dihydromenaquinone-9 sulfotransferase